MVELFQRDKRTISEHVRNIFKEGELAEAAVVRKSRITAADGKIYQVEYFNLDAIISVGYRVNSKRGTQSASGPRRYSRSIWSRGWPLTSGG